MIKGVRVFLRKPFNLLDLHKNFVSNIFPGIIGIFGLILLWYMLSWKFGEVFIPYPHNVLTEVKVLLLSNNFFVILYDSMYRAFAGFIIAVLAGSAAGLLSGSLRFIEKVFFIPVIVMQGTPPLLWIVPVILIFSVGDLSVIAVSALVVFPLVVLNVSEGVKSINTHYFDMFKIYAPSKIMVLNYLIIPSLYPYYRSVVVLGFVLSMKSSIIAEWFGSKSGIGKLINSYYYNYNIVSFYAASLIFIVLVILTGYLLRVLTGKILNRRVTEIDFTKDKPDGEFKLKSLPGQFEIKCADFSYGRHKILNSFSLSIKEGETAVLTGKSGSGKTTLARIACGILKADSGDVILAKRPAILYQDDLLLEHFDLAGNVSLPAAGDKDGFYKVLHAIKLCGLSGYENYFMEQLSGGMRKRAAFARALVFDPDFIILDEPFNNLDRESRRELWDLFFKLFAERGIPAFIITHYPEELEGRNVRFISLE